MGQKERKEAESIERTPSAMIGRKNEKILRFERLPSYDGQRRIECRPQHQRRRAGKAGTRSILSNRSFGKLGIAEGRLGTIRNRR